MVRDGKKQPQQISKYLDRNELREAGKKLIEAAKSENTKRAYASDVAHFENNWGGLLPASRESIVDYLTFYSEHLSVATLTRRLVSLAMWHKSYGFPDPTDNAHVREAMKGIRKLHNRPPSQAKPLTLHDLGILVNYLEGKINKAAGTGLVTAKHEKDWIKAHRDLAMVLIGFWRGFRADSLCHLKLEHIKPTMVSISGGRQLDGLSIFLASSKGDREARGESFQLASMPEYCPVVAYKNWVHAADLENTRKGFVFRPFEPKGGLSEKQIAPGSMTNWMKRLCKEAGLQDADEYSSHSLRRGLANLLRDRGADVKVLMDHIGWKSADTAIRYLDNGSKGTELLLGMDN